jgi:signal transduction histidine kinase
VQRQRGLALQTKAFAELAQAQTREADCLDTSCYQALFETLSKGGAASPGARDMVVREGSTIFFASPNAPSLEGLSPGEATDLALSAADVELAKKAKALKAEVFWYSEQPGRLWLRVPQGNREVLLTINDSKLLETAPFDSDARTFFVGAGEQGTFTGAFAALAQTNLVDLLPARGEVGRVTAPSGEAFLVVNATSSENPAFLTLGKTPEFFAAVPEAAVLAPARRLTFAAGLSLVLFIGIALALAAVMSRRLLAVSGSLRTSLVAIGRGESVQATPLSTDELGGDLIEHVNHLAQRLNERSKRAELDNWQRVIRVLSHEINNTIAPLRTVSAILTDEVSERVRNTDDLRRASTMMADRIEALEGFVRRFADLARLPVPTLERTNLKQVVANATRMFTEESLERAIELELSAHEDLFAQVDAGQFERVVINLVKNALEASSSGQKVSVRLVNAGRFAHLEVEDQGAGISPEAQANLFVPSFSTKPGGSGIGLALAQQIVLAHRGWITTETGTHGGALFRVVLPLGPPT